MKMIIAFLVALFVFLNGNTQRVGINTHTPHVSAVLDINSNDKGLLIPRVYLTGINDSVTITSPAASLLVYNTNTNMPGGKGFYFNSGNSSLPVWTNLKTKEFELPFTDTITTPADAFTIKNFGSGYALNVQGKIKISDTKEKKGKFLMTSWPDGNVNWVGGVAFSVNQTSAGTISVASNTDTRVLFNNKLYDLDTNFHTSSSFLYPSTFIAPTLGIYHFDATIIWNSFSGSTTGVYGALTFMVNDGYYASDRRNAGTASFSNSLSLDIPLSAGDRLYLVAYHNSSSTQTIYNYFAANRFSGRFVSTF
jgi:hypothetical protein